MLRTDFFSTAIINIERYSKVRNKFETPIIYVPLELLKQISLLEYMIKDINMKNFFYVIPDQMEELSYSVDLADINALAAFAVTLSPKSNVTETLGYAMTLFEYYQENDNILKDCYNKLTSSYKGKEFLCSTIQLCLLEKTFRENGIDEHLAKLYNKNLEVYQKQLKLNNDLYNNITFSQTK